jgi:hypothetical protein
MGHFREDAMNDRHGAPRLACWAVGLAVAALAAIAYGSSYLNEDARISGKEIHAFQDGGESVSVVLGDFRLTVGKHVVSGRDAVLWIRTKTIADLPHHEITVYVEGDARVVEPSGSTTSDRVMVVTVRNRGRLTAAGHLSDRALKDFPLYRRAIAARRGAAKPTDRHAPPPLVVSTQPTTRPVGPGARPVGPVQVTRPVPPPKPGRVDPVHFHASRFASKEVGEGADKHRVTTARGNVYLSQGNPDSELFLELRAQAAVVFSRRKEPKAAKVPWAPQIRGIKVPGGGEETVTGVYLEGDVIIARGERYLRGPAAYYDFASDRALIVEPVFRAVQEQRNIPVYVRAKEARILSEREVQFKDAKVSTSDFYTPSYHIGASEAYLKNTTPYDAKGVRLGEQSWLTHLKDATFNVRGLPVMYWPESRLDFTQGHSPLRKAQVGSHGRLGFGGETEWQLFRLLGLLEPEGFKGTLDLNWYDRGPFMGARLEYDRETFSGYGQMYGLIDQDENDDFGEERKNILAPRDRGRILARHKQFLPDDWELQFELSYLCDRTFLEQFFPDEAYTGKEQETLIYAKKQRDNWAITSLLKYRMNRFQEQTESVPDVGFHLIGESLLDDKLTLFSESRAGAKRHRLPNYVTEAHGEFFARLDTRNEINWPLHVGPLNVVPYAVGRATYWSDEPEPDGRNCRLYGQLGVRANLHVWRVYRDVQSRLWDLHGLKHVVTPEIVAFFGESARGVGPEQLFPMDPDVEEHLLRREGGLAAGVSQRLQTKRGPAGNRRTVDWMRLNVIFGAYDNGPDLLPADGRFFFSRPEYSLGRNHANFDYTWNISDATAFLADGNFDVDTGRMRRWSAGLAVVRDPRLRYYVGVRRIMDLDSSVATGGVSYRLSSKYSLQFFQQIDMDYDGHRSLASSITLVRKFPRWYVGATFVMDHRTDDLGLYLTIWPEGIPEVRLGSSRVALLAESTMN